jgi:hypothetical protein
MDGVALMEKDWMTRRVKNVHGAWVARVVPVKVRGGVRGILAAEFRILRIFGPPEHDGGVSFAKEWSQSRVSRMAALLH